ncbi:MAG: hypothetical protein ACR2P1_14215 [Pseudomonadales bacterium]
MRLFNTLSSLLNLGSARGLARRYFVVNGFDGALTMLGLATGFYIGDQTSPAIMLDACLGAAVALFMSGSSSAYISEAAEKRRELSQLEQSMLVNLDDTKHGDAARKTPVIIAAVNGLSPLLISLLIITPLFIARAGWMAASFALPTMIMLALLLIFALGVFLGNISGRFWLYAGMRALGIAVLTIALIYLLKLW